MSITVQIADITTLEVDAIVNAANEACLGGGGVDGAIHRAAGPALLEACRALPETHPGVRCPTGEARLTPAFDLPCRAVIHTVGPFYPGNEDAAPAQLADCYRNTLDLAAEHGYASVAFPAISTGVYGYPAEAAAAIAVTEMRAALERHTVLDRLIACCFDRRSLDIYNTLLGG